MELKIITDNENPLFNRREIQGEIHANVNPQREEVINLISEKTKVPKDKIKIKTIQAKFGSKVFLIVANIYSSVEDKNKIERMKKKEKEALDRAKKIEETPKEEKVTEESSIEVEKIPEQQEPVKENKEKSKEEDKKGVEEKEVSEGAKEKEIKSEETKNDKKSN